MSKQPKKPQNALLGDLESIRDLFDEDPEPTATPPPEEVPTLDDVVDIPDEPAPAAEQGPRMDDDLFQVLLGDEWRTSAALVFSQAREKIEQNSPQWAPEDTDELNAALKVRIDETMQGWMRGMLIEHIANLHETLLEVLSRELPTIIDDIIESGARRKATGKDARKKKKKDGK